MQVNWPVNEVKEPAQKDIPVQPEKIDQTKVDPRLMEFLKSRQDEYLLGSEKEGKIPTFVNRSATTGKEGVIEYFTKKELYPEVKPTPVNGSVDYILRSSLAQHSGIAKIGAIGATELQKKEFSQEIKDLSEYDPNKIEQAASFVLGMFVDLPLFKGIGSIAKPIAEKTVIETGKAVMKSLVKAGVKEGTANKIATNAVSRYINTSSQLALQSGYTLGAYSGIKDVADQIAEGKTIGDIDYKEALKESSKGFVTGSVLGVFGSQYGGLKQALTGKMPQGMLKNLANAGINVAEIPVEGGAFTIANAITEKQPITLGSYIENTGMALALKVSQLPEKIITERRKSDNIDFTNTEKNILKKSLGDDVSNTNYFFDNPGKVGDMLKDASVPLTTKAKVMYSTMGDRMEEVDFVPSRVSADKSGNLKLYNKNNELIDSIKFGNKQEADEAALKIQQEADDYSFNKLAGEMPIKEQSKVIDKLKSQGIEENQVINALAKNVEERSPEDNKVLGRFKDEVNKFYELKAKEDGTQKTQQEKNAPEAEAGIKADEEGKKVQSEVLEIDVTKLNEEQKEGKNIEPEDIEYIYNLNKNLNNIGGWDKYHSYVKTIFPKTKINDILYHGTPNKLFEEFDYKKQGASNYQQGDIGFYFTSNKDIANQFTTYDPDPMGVYEQEFSKIKGQIIPVVVNASKIKTYNESGFNVENKIEKINNAKKNGYDAVKFTAIDKEYGYVDEYIIFNSNNIHILGSKKDYNNFAEYQNLKDIKKTGKEAKLEEIPQIDISKLNTEQQEQYKEMVGQYGQKRADELVSMFLPEVEKYKYTPQEFEKLKKEGQKSASNQQKAEPIPEREVRPQMGEEAPLQQPGKGASGKGVKEEAQPEKEKVNSFREKLIKEELEKPKTSGLGDFFGTKKKGNDFYKTYINKERGIPKEFYKGNLAVAGKVARAELEARWLGNDLYKKAEKAYPEFNEQNKNDIQAALENMGTTKESQADALKNIPKELHPEVIKMRQSIDNLTDQLIKLDVLSEESNLKYAQNKGLYVTRSYRRGADKDWNWENIPLKVKEDAFKVISDYYPEYTVDKIEGILKSMIADKEISGLLAGGKYGKVKSDILKRRSQFLTDNPEIRDFLGEYRDPAYNYAVSIAKMSELIERTKFLRNATEEGLKNGWLSEDITPTHNTKIGQESPFSFSVKRNFQKEGDIEWAGGGVSIKEPQGSKGYKPLSEYYTTPEIAKAFDSFNEINKNVGGLFKSYMKLVTGVKLAKTAYDIRGIERNFLSNPINVIGNGNWNFNRTVEEMKNVFQGGSPKEKQRNMVAFLTENNIIKDNVDAGMIRANLRQIENYSKDLGKFSKNPIKSALNKVNRSLLNAYEFGDDFWKSFRFFSEKARYKDMYLKQGKENEAADRLSTEKAVEILHDTTAFYSQQPKMLQALRYFPATGTFVSFPYLTMRNAFHTIKLASKEMKNPDTFHIGLQRIAGITVATSALSLMAMMHNRGNLKDGGDMEDLRRFLPYFWKNDLIAIKKDLGNGKYRFNNYSYLDYYNSVTTPTLMLLRKFASNKEVTKDDLFESMRVFFEPYMSEDILYQRLKNLQQNYDPDKNKKIYYPGDFADKPMQAFKDISEYMWEAFEPGTLTHIRKIHELAKEGGDWKGYLTGMLKGNQVRTLDIEKSLRYYNFRKAKSDIEDARGKFYQAMTSKNKTGESLASDIKLAEERINKAIESLREDMEAAVRQGVPRAMVNNILKDTRLDKDIQNALTYNSGIKIDNNGSIVAK